MIRALANGVRCRPKGPFQVPVGQSLRSLHLGHWRPQPAGLRGAFLAGRRHSSESPLVCTIFDKDGRVASVAAHIPRKRFLRENGLHSRDLRHIDGQAALVPRILVHKGNILVNICDLRVLIRCDKVLVFASQDPAVAERLSMLVYDFQTKLPSSDSGQVYEQRALETVLVHAMAFLEVKLARILSSVEVLLNELEENIERNTLRELLAGSKALDAFHRQCLAVRKALDDALEDTDDIHNMYLTDSRGANSDEGDIELLLETYYKQADELVQKAGGTAKDVDTTAEVVNMMIDSNRNSIMLFRLKTSIVTVSFTVAIAMAGLYGMNLDNWIEETSWGMPVVSSVVLLTTVLGTRYNFNKLKLARRLHMSGYVPHVGELGERSRMWRWLENTKHAPNRKA